MTHELKSPLTAIQGAAELLAEQGEAMTPAERARFLANIQADARKLTLLVERLRDLARAENPQLGGEITLEALAAALRARGEPPVLAVEGDPALRLPMSRDNALIVFANLLDNALSHGAGHARLSAAVEGDALRMELADDGAGVSPNNRAKIFDAFFTTRREQGGAGMGLGIVRAMLRAHGGDIRLLEPERGAAFEITLPRAGNPM